MEGDSGIVARTYGTSGMTRAALPPRMCFSCCPVDVIRYLTHSCIFSLCYCKVLLERISVTDGQRQSFAIDSSDHPRTDQTLENRLASRYFVSEAVAVAAANTVRHREASQDEEVQLLTIRYFEPNVRVRIGGLVTARSVKYLGNLASSLLDQETRDSWWNELRDEIRYSK